MTSSGCLYPCARYFVFKMSQFSPHQMYYVLLARNSRSKFFLSCQEYFTESSVFENIFCFKIAFNLKLQASPLCFKGTASIQTRFVFVLCFNQILAKVSRLRTQVFVNHFHFCLSCSPVDKYSCLEGLTERRDLHLSLLADDLVNRNLYFLLCPFSFLVFSHMRLTTLSHHGRSPPSGCLSVHCHSGRRRRTALPPGPY